jgi:hypothetical protein
MTQKDKYLEYAANCIALYNVMSSPDERAKLLQMAQKWHALAQHSVAIDALLEKQEVLLSQPALPLPPKEDDHTA